MSTRIASVDPLSLLRGPATLWAGVKWILAHPKYLILGLLPALASAGILLTAVVLIGAFSGVVVGLFAPLTAGLFPWLATLIAVAIQAALVVGGLALAYVLFVGLALAIGDPIYSKIASQVSEERGIILVDFPWSVGVKDAFTLIWKGALVALIAFLLGFIPLVGPFLGFIVTWIFVPFFLSEDLLGRTLLPRGFEGEVKRALLLREKGAVWSYGALSQLIFSVPILSLLFMPASVAGAAMLAHEVAEAQIPR